MGQCLLLYSLHWNFIYYHSFIFFPKGALIFKPGSKTWIVLGVTKLPLLLSACLFCLVLEAGDPEPPAQPWTSDPSCQQIPTLKSLQARITKPAYLAVANESAFSSIDGELEQQKMKAV